MGHAMSSCLLWPPFSWSSQGQQHLKIIVLSALGVEQTMVHVHGEFIFFLSNDFLGDPRELKVAVASTCLTVAERFADPVVCGLWELCYLTQFVFFTDIDAGKAVLPVCPCLPRPLLFLWFVEERWLEQTAFCARYYILSLNVVSRPDCFLVSLLNILSVNRLCLGVGKMVTITIHED